MIIQGSNEPIVLEFEQDMASVQKFSAVLLKKTTSITTSTVSSIKKWDEDSMVVDTADSKKISLPLTESETMEFPSGEVTLEVKWLSNDSVWFAEESTIQVKKWYDTTKLTSE